MRLLHLPIFHHKRIPLAPIITEDGSALERKIQSFGELGVGITKETNLADISKEF